MDEKLTDNEIVKAKELIKKLEEAYHDYYDTTKSMPYDIDATLRETAICLENSLNEINRQQAEIKVKNKLLNIAEAKFEAYEMDKKQLESDIANANMNCEHLQAENERLSVLAELGNTRANDYRVMRDRALKAEAENEELKLFTEIKKEEIAKLITKTKAEAYKEFAELLHCQCESIINQPHNENVRPISWKVAYEEFDEKVDNLSKELVGEDK